MMKDFPDSFISRLKEQFPLRFKDILEGFTGDPEISVRLNPAKGTGLFADNERVPWCQTGRYLKERPVFTLDPLFHAGAYYVQEASSMFLEAVIKSLGLKEKIRALDLCAAPGGKATHLSTLLPEGSLVVANEVIRTRASILKENVIKWGDPAMVVTSSPVENIGKLKGYFDLILVDAPCSGEGMFRKEEKALELWSAENVAMCAARQENILEEILPALATGGIIIYSTCTLSPEENEDQVLKLISRGYETVKIHTEEFWGVEEVPIKNGVAYRLLPDRLKGEGLFMACLIKQQEQEVAWPQTKLRFPKASKGEVEMLSGWTVSEEDYNFFSFHDDFFALRKGLEEDIAAIPGLNIRNLGTAMGKIKGKGLVPAHDLALSPLVENLPFVDLDHPDALAYLRKEPFALPGSPPKGWVLIRYQGINLGWAKNLGNRVNNYYPTEWRIRM